jgi:hypothetical protein
MRQYYLHDGSSEQGPFSLEELQEKQLKPDTPVWHEGLESWTTASQVEELKPTLQFKPPPLKSSGKPSSRYPAERKSNQSRFVWIGAGVLAVIIIAILLYNNNQSQYALNNLQSSVSQKEMEDAQEKFKQAETRRRWSEFVKLEEGDYHPNPFGGITGLDLTVSNLTGYAIDEVEVEVDYIKESGVVYKTETVTFKNLPANVKQTKYAPESSRGTSVKTRVKSVTAHSFNFCYNMHRNGVEGDDPWKCQ